jgi:hypothetical protein
MHDDLAQSVAPLARRKSSQQTANRPGRGFNTFLISFFILLMHKHKESASCTASEAHSPVSSPVSTMGSDDHQSAHPLQPVLCKLQRVYQQHQDCRVCSVHSSWNAPGMHAVMPAPDQRAQLAFSSHAVPTTNARISHPPMILMSALG